MLRKGDRAPEFPLADGQPVRTCHGRPVRLAELTAGGAAVLVFLRGFG